MKIGVAYYPEQWPEERWKRDVELMKAAQVSVVRVGEFSWHGFEPSEGVFDFSLMDRAVDLLTKNGIGVILGTPTPAYPPWLHRKFPDIHQIASDGRVKEFGQRQDACKNHPGYLEYAFRVTEKFVEHFGGHQGIVAWQTDNELGCHGTTRCYCRHCEEAFQRWLAARYDNDIRRLNREWGTAFWSQVYNSFGEISVPNDTADRAGHMGQSPSLTLDFFRFSSDTQVRFNARTAALIRRRSPGLPITHNLMGAFGDIDYFKLAADLDIVSWDNYPFFRPENFELPPPGFSADLMRGLKNKSVWVMEQAVGAAGWDRIFPAPEPGRVRLWAYQAVARGADLISFFRWRSARFGTEQYWFGAIDHDGEPRRRYHEMKSFGEEMARLDGALSGTNVVADVAILVDYDAGWALEIQPQSHTGISQFRVAAQMDRALVSAGLTADIVSAESRLDRYRAVIAPALYVVDASLRKKLEAYVESGGTLVLGPRTAVKDEYNAMYEQTSPAGLQDLAGCSVLEIDSFGTLNKPNVGVVDSSGRFAEAHGLAELLETSRSAQTVMKYRGRFYDETPAVVHNHYGAGDCYYIGTYLEDAGLEDLLREVLTPCGISFARQKNPSLEIVCREKDGRKYRFYMNHSNAGLTVQLLHPGVDLLSQKRCEHSVTVAARDLLIVAEEG